MKNSFKSSLTSFFKLSLTCALMMGCGQGPEDSSATGPKTAASDASANTPHRLSGERGHTEDLFTDPMPTPLPASEDPKAGGCLSRSQRRQYNLTTPSTLPQERPSLSETFAKKCSGCHGRSGEGKGDFPDIRGVSYQNFIFSVNSGRSGIMPAFSPQEYPRPQLDLDFFALTGKEATYLKSQTCPIDKTGSNPEIAPAIAYKTQAKGPKAFGLGFGLDPFVLPYVMCKDLPDIKNPGETRSVCANIGISGSTEEGYRYADFGVCKDIRTQRPYRSIPVKIRNQESDATAGERLKDHPEFGKELAWVTDQIRSSGCICCHDSSVDKRASFWDIAKNKIWTDQLDKYAVEIFTGRVDSTALGAYQPKDNYGFDRFHTGLPTTDVPRMQAFFKGLAGNLGTTEKEIQAMPPLADVLASQLREEPKRCPKGVGVDFKTGKIRWNGKIFDRFPLPFVPGRFIYVLEEDAQTPLVTPNLDKPIGTLWRLDASSFIRGFTSNTVQYGKVPKNAVQTIPDPERFQVKPLQKGKIYRLVVQLDVAFPLTNCLFTYGDNM